MIIKPAIALASDAIPAIVPAVYFFRALNISFTVRSEVERTVKQRAKIVDFFMIFPPKLR